MNRGLLILCILGTQVLAQGFVGLQPPQRPFEVMQHDVYQDTRDLGLEIMRVAPAAHSIYVGIGRSPTPVIRFFTLLKSTPALNLPLTAFKTNGKTLDPALEVQIFSYFDHFLKSVPAGTKMIFIDYVNYGESLRTFLNIFLQYRKSRNLTTPFGFVGFGNGVGKNSFAQVKAEFPQVEMNFIRLAPLSQFSEHLADMEFRYFAEYGEARLLSSCELPLKREREWNELGGMLRSHMRHDDVLIRRRLVD